MLNQPSSSSPRTRLLAKALSFLVLTVAVLAQTGVAAQTFTSGSDGSDGALNLTVAQHGPVFVFDPAAFGPALDPDGDGVYHFTTISVESGLTVRLSADVLGARPVQWLATGAVQIDGILDLTGGDGHVRGATAVRSVAGAGGYSGGSGQTAISAWQPGNGPGAAQVASRSAGHVTASEGVAYGNSALLPILGGSGGSGGIMQGITPTGAGGGAGGGAILIASSVSITVDGQINVKGGCGQPSGTSNPDPSGGHGSSGAVRLMSTAIDGTGSLFAGAVSNTACGNNNVASGSRGRVRLEAYQYNFTGAIDTDPKIVVPGLVSPPSTAPKVRIVSVDGVPVPANASGVFPPADVTIDDPVTVTVGIEANYVPLFTTVELTVVTDEGDIQTVTSTPLNGLIDLSTATADVLLPHGFSSMFAKATWTP